MRFNKVKTIFLSSLFTLCCCFHAVIFADTLVTKLSSDKVALGETVTVSFNLNNTTINTSPDFTPLEKDFHILSTQYGTAINMINGATQAQTFWQLILEPKTAGELTIPEINFGNIKSSSRKLWVEQGTAINANNQDSSSTFVQATLNTHSPYIQSQVLYTFKLFYRTALENPTIKPPQINDGIMTQVGDGKLYQTSIKGEPFYVLEKNFAIFPQKTGKFDIPATQFSAFQQDINFNLMHDPFSIATNKRINLATPSFTLNVQKIPESFNGNVWLPAKNITLSEQWSTDRYQCETGDPITRTISIEAQGLRADQIPDLAVDKITGVNIYTDPPHRSNSVQNNSIIGIWQQKITYIPSQPQSFTISALKLNWWNTQTNRNAIAQLKPITIQVQGKTVNPVTAAENNQAIATTHIETKQSADLPQNLGSAKKQNFNSSANHDTPFYLSIWFWISIVLLVSWLITLRFSFKLFADKKTNLTSSSIKDSHQSDPKAVQQFNNNVFVKACDQGNTALVQKLLLSWAGTQWQNPPRSLAKLSEMISDENFKKELESLEQALYANCESQWNGHALLTSYQRVIKNKQHRFKSTKAKRKYKDSLFDPLPPLNPEA